MSLTHYSSVLAVKNLEETLDFFINKLGFKLIDSYGNPVYYAEIKRDESQSLMFLQQANFSGPTTTNASLAFYSTDVDVLYKEFLSKNVEIDEPLEDKEYMMREFRIVDPNGYLIVFRQPK